MASEKELNKYYSKFQEEKRLKTRHGTVEFITSMKFIHNYADLLNKPYSEIKIVDIGAATGAYSVPLSKEGFDVTAVELCKHNLEVLESKHEKIKIWPGNALDLSFLPEDKFDIAILFGPLYHLHKKEEKLQAISQARRVLKNGGILLACYIMNDYAVISYCFGEKKINEAIENHTLDENFMSNENANSLYSYVRLSNIDEIQAECGMKRLELFAQDGSANYIRPVLNSLSEQEFNQFVNYHLATCQLPELLGASTHVVDVLQK